MTKAAIRAAVAEARRFIEKAEAVPMEQALTYGGDKCGEHASFGKQAAAMKRASLDLSMALAAMRKTPRW